MRTVVEARASLEDKTRASQQIVDVLVERDLDPLAGLGSKLLVGIVDDGVHERR